MQNILKSPSENKKKLHTNINIILKNIVIIQLCIFNSKLCFV